MRAIFRKNNYLQAIGERHAKITDHKWNEMDGNAIVDLHLTLVHGVLVNIYVSIMLILKITNKINNNYVFKSSNYF